VRREYAMPITKDDLNIISQSIDRQIKKAVDAIIDANKKVVDGQRNYFKETERLLYSYPALKLKVSQDEEDIVNNQVIYKSKSKDIVRYSASGTSIVSDPDEEYIKSRMASMERTKKEIVRIERALETIQEDQYYDIIPMKYWDLIQPDIIAESLHCDERTYRRHKNRLVNKLKIVLFGADALEL
jgi:hypothetical protein